RRCPTGRGSQGRTWCGETWINPDIGGGGGAMDQAELIGRGGQERLANRCICASPSRKRADCQVPVKVASSTPKTRSRREGKMVDLSRRAHLRQLGAAFAGLGSAALGGWPSPAPAAEAEIPPEGIGKGIKHISYCDIGGRPDSVQVMFGRQHIY